MSNLIKFLVLKLNSQETRVLLVGEYELANNVKKALDQSFDYLCVGHCYGDGIKDLKKIIKEKNVDEIFIPSKAVTSEVHRLLLEIKLSGIKIRTYWQFNEENEGKIDVSLIDEAWLLYSSGFDILHDSFQKRAKRFVDILAATILFTATLPLMLLTAILIKIESKGPILFKQTRIGLNGTDFTVYKFRSMHLHNEEKYSKYSQGEKDDRISAFGQFLRKTRIDELPQIFNILKGDMSFIGPRPEWDKLGRTYEEQLPHYKIRYLVKPGITGWAQVMYPYGANLEDTLRKLEYDLYYIKHQNIVLDIQILFKTMRIVLFGKGQ
jgi:exopolysaccharide biosynthesis polyprenyl glycosylphosphotransferase